MACGFAPQASYQRRGPATPRLQPPSQRSSRAFWSHHSNVPKGILLGLCSKYRVDAACKAWRRLTAQAGRIKSLCTYPWIPKVKT
jgi:hypothetical protein